MHEECGNFSLSRCHCILFPFRHSTSTTHTRTHTPLSASFPKQVSTSRRLNCSSFRCNFFPFYIYIYFLSLPLSLFSPPFAFVRISFGILCSHSFHLYCSCSFFFYSAGSSFLACLSLQDPFRTSQPKLYEIICSQCRHRATIPTHWSHSKIKQLQFQLLCNLFQ